MQMFGKTHHIINKFGHKSALPTNRMGSKLQIISGVFPSLGDYVKEDKPQSSGLEK